MLKIVSSRIPTYITLIKVCSRQNSVNKWGNGQCSNEPVEEGLCVPIHLCSLISWRVLSIYMTITSRVGGHNHVFQVRHLKLTKVKLLAQGHKHSKGIARTGTQVFYLHIRYSLEQCCSLMKEQSNRQLFYSRPLEWLFISSVTAKLLTAPAHSRQNR